MAIGYPSVLPLAFTAFGSTFISSALILVISVNHGHDQMVNARVTTAIIFAYVVHTRAQNNGRHAGNLLVCDTHCL
jgi:hypothetical protein